MALGDGRAEWTYVVYSMFTQPPYHLRTHTYTHTHTADCFAMMAKLPGELEKLSHPHTYFYQSLLDNNLFLTRIEEFITDFFPT